LLSYLLDNKYGAITCSNVTDLLNCSSPATASVGVIPP
jgi:hypothetical protein